MASTCRSCKRWGLPCHFCAQSAPHPSPHWSNEDWNGEKQRTKEKERKQEQSAQQKEEDLIKDYFPSSPVYDPIFKQDPLPCCTPKEKMALDPNYYPQGYIPEEQDDALLLVKNEITLPEKALLEEQEKEDAPLLINNLINSLEKNTPEDPMEEEKDSIKTLTDPGQDIGEEKDNY